MNRPARRLQNRLLIAFALFAIVNAGVFGGYAMIFMYAVEDDMLSTMLDQEADAQLHGHAATGRWSAPREASMQLFTDTAAFPADFAATFAKEPWRREFAGSDSRHYHVKRIDPPAPAAPVWLVAEVSRQLVVRPIREHVLTLLAGSAAAFLSIALGIGYWLAQRSARPLAQLADVVERMSPDDLPRDLAGRFGNDEIGILARGLAAMADRIRIFIDRERAFTRDASHELRTPLAVIRSAAERLDGETGLPAAARGQLAQIRESTHHMEQTVATLLSLAREAPPVADASVAVVPMLERVIVEQSMLLDGKDVAVDVMVPDDTITTLPESALRILLANLIGNAFAHTQAGRVRIDVDQRRLRITNSADGEDPARRWANPRPFSKGDDSDGLGLGMSIMRRLCEHHAIDLRIEGLDGRTTMVSVALDRLPTNDAKRVVV